MTTICQCVDPDPSNCSACASVETYRARDARISIGLPILQDNNEFEYPGAIDGVIVGFYATRHHAGIALHSILDAGMDRLIQGNTAVLDCDYATYGF
jgi:hypothetical protein